MQRKTKTTGLILGLLCLTSWYTLTNFVFVPEEEQPAFLSQKDNWAQNTLDSLTLRQKIGQFFMLAAYSNRDEAHLLELEKHVTENEVGGFIFFQGNRKDTKENIERLQAKSEIPLLIGMDAEWGASMRLKGVERLPYQMTLGAANDEDLTRREGEIIAEELRTLGIHINFAPVVDINSNPNNPVIGFRSFGEQATTVSKLGYAFATGMESAGVMSCLKHFPGHGDTDVDSHKGLPTITHSKDEIMLSDIMPFKYGFNKGLPSVMIAHLNIPALDPSGTPASLSKPIVTDLLKNQLNYKGLIFSDALNMKGVADFYGKTEVVVKAFKAGIDILLFPESVEDAMNAIEAEVKAGRISMEDVNERCLKILKAKQHYIPKNGPSATRITAIDKELVSRDIYKQALTLIKNEGDILPLKKIDEKVALVNIGTRSFQFTKRFKDYCKADEYTVYSGTEALEKFDKDAGYSTVFINIYATSMIGRTGYNFPIAWQDFTSALPDSVNVILSVYGNPYVIGEVKNLENIDAIVLAYENNPTVHDISAQLLFGALGYRGHLPVSVSDAYKAGIGIQTEGGLRLSFVLPEELGLDRLKLREIDKVVENGIKEGAYPGSQVVVAKDGKVFYQKSFGHHTYAAKTKVEDDHIYDLASITKIASSTLGLMGLESQGKFDLNEKLNTYIPEVTSVSAAYGNIVIREMMAHQAGLVAWIPFYTKTLEAGAWNPNYLSSIPKDGFETQVAEDLYISDTYTDSIYKKILNTSLGPKRYKYSDLGYYFVKKIIEKIGNAPLNNYMETNYYRAMGLPTMGYLPLAHHSKEIIVPTENDQIFRKQLIHGYVHDQGAAMLGGVGGHAGLFSNATDLAALMQMFLNGGEYAGQRFVSEEVVKKYTDCQFCPTNRRGAGFDKPVRDLNGGPTCNLVSLESFGHSGFTGTLSWADPFNGINYVFLSNRIYPDAENPKLVRMDIRTEIQRIIYEAVNAAEM
ncbi:beta-glucosidase [Lishizhenia tianjinensis]|uniref:beta-N-acetylhexosaminidase n=1 Tax=Lishizhenia tianjinensis TaxID=477690 RepID=A0A1I6YG00_9FLAO|nr:glycoside hydrolase family 3 N-terminal domain-containing protein [Lishizhenia tianjinensis]SFT49251.1 beta-glucosidase [Lishizhenia tianjinensis]